MGRLRLGLVFASRAAGMVKRSLYVFMAASGRILYDYNSKPTMANENSSPADQYLNENCNKSVLHEHVLGCQRSIYVYFIQ